MDYCEKPTERREEPHARAWFLALADGNPQVFQFCWAVWNFEHVLDDLIDRDKPVSHAELAKALCDFWDAVALNPWFGVNRQLLHGGLQSAIRRWVDGDRMATGRNSEARRLSRAVRCGDIDFFMQVAYLVGGWEHQERMWEMGFRSYDE